MRHPDDPIKYILDTSKNPAMQDVWEQARNVSITNRPTNIYGETGSGKEMIARWIHRSSERGLFVAINCASQPKDLIQDILFGHEKGSFTGALNETEGLLLLADQGTLFLDEVTEMNVEMKNALLRAIEYGYYHLSSSPTKELKPNFRIITSSTEPIDSLDESIYYRLKGVEIYVPPLRDRKEDIEALVYHFLELYKSQERKEVKMTDEVLDLFMEYDWPGNIRELETLVANSVAMTKGEYITDEYIRQELGGSLKIQSGIIDRAFAGDWDLKTLEKEYTLLVLKECGDNHSEAAKRLGIARNTLWRKLRGYDQ